MVESGTAPTASWLSSVSTCSSIVSGIEIDFVVANTGERVSPQAAIIGAQVTLFIPLLDACAVSVAENDAEGELRL